MTKRSAADSSEPFGHASARRAVVRVTNRVLQGDKVRQILSWEIRYLDLDSRSLADDLWMFHGVNLAQVDDHIERIEAEGYESAAGLRLHRTAMLEAFISDSRDKLLRHTYWLLLSLIGQDGQIPNGAASNPQAPDLERLDKARAARAVRTELMRSAVSRAQDLTNQYRGIGYAEHDIAGIVAVRVGRSSSWYRKMRKKREIC